MEYRVVGTNIIESHPWDGIGTPPLRVKVLAYGKVWAPNGCRRTFYDYYPPDNEFIIISEMMSAEMRSLTVFCMRHRLLDGDLQWNLYMTDEIYRKYVEQRAEQWHNSLKQIETYWEGYRASQAYHNLRTEIRHELLEFEHTSKAEQKKKRRLGMLKIMGGNNSLIRAKEFTPRKNTEKCESSYR